jgi:hypothetical protein
MGGSRVSRPRYYFNILLTFLLSGIWHGADWTYAIWGLTNGIYLSVGSILRSRFHFAPRSSISPIWLRLKSFGQILTTFALICIAWIFFRASDLTQALLVIKKIFFDWSSLPQIFTHKDVMAQYVYMNFPASQFYWCLFGLMVLIIADILLYKNWFGTSKIWANGLVRFCGSWFLISTALLLIIILSKSVSQQFIYFQF